jgi:hypothetical protein
LALAVLQFDHTTTLFELSRHSCYFSVIETMSSRPTKLCARFYTTFLIHKFSLDDLSNDLEVSLIKKLGIVPPSIELLITTTLGYPSLGSSEPRSELIYNYISLASVFQIWWQFPMPLDPRLH